MAALGLVTGLFAGLVIGILIVIGTSLALLAWPRPRRPAAATPASGHPPAGPPDVTVTLSEAFLSDVLADQLRAFHLPVGMIEDAAVDLLPDRSAVIGLGVRLPVLGRVAGSVHCRLHIGPPLEAELGAVQAGRVRLPGLVVGAIERRLNAELERALAHYPVAILDARTTDDQATVDLRVDPAVASLLMRDGRQANYE